MLMDCGALQAFSRIPLIRFSFVWNFLSWLGVFFSKAFGFAPAPNCYLDICRWMRPRVAVCGRMELYLN
jgi:hypothetical protein